jgi:hypothetical protein
MIIRIMGKHAFSSPSTIDHNVIPKILVSAYFSGMILIAGTANSDKSIVTMRVVMALL